MMLLVYEHANLAVLLVLKNTMQVCCFPCNVA